MPQGVIINNSSGGTIFDSTLIKGGTIAGTYTYAHGVSATLTYPEFAGRTVKINVLSANPSGHGVTTDTSLGYPRVTVSTNGGGVPRIFQVMIL